MSQHEKLGSSDGCVVCRSSRVTYDALVCWRLYQSGQIGFFETKFEDMVFYNGFVFYNSFSKFVSLVFFVNIWCFWLFFMAKNGDVIFKNAKFGKWFFGVGKNLTVLPCIVLQNVLRSALYCIV